MHLLDAAVVNEAGIGAGASDDEPGPEQLGRQVHLVVVYESCRRLQRKEGGDRLRGEKKKEGDKRENDKYKHVRGGVRVSGNGYREDIMRILSKHIVMKTAFSPIWRQFDAAAFREFWLPYKRKNFTLGRHFNQSHQRRRWGNCSNAPSLILNQPFRWVFKWVRWAPTYQCA